MAAASRSVLAVTAGVRRAERPARPGNGHTVGKPTLPRDHQLVVAPGPVASLYQELGLLTYGKLNEIEAADLAGATPATPRSR